MYSANSPRQSVEKARDARVSSCAWLTRASTILGWQCPCAGGGMDDEWVGWDNWGRLSKLTVLSSVIHAAVSGSVLGSKEHHLRTLLPVVVVVASAAVAVVVVVAGGISSGLWWLQAGLPACKLSGVTKQTACYLDREPAWGILA